MNRRDEELDDLIDRVAEAATFVPPDAALAALVADRIRTARSPFLRWPHILAAVSAAAVVIAALTLPRDERIESVNVVVRPAEERIAPLRWRVSPDPARFASADTETGTSAIVERVAAPHLLLGVPQIPALSSPLPLEVEELETDVLAIAPADVTPLNLPALAVAELGSEGNQKE
jgi:hypothetical protein